MSEFLQNNLVWIIVLAIAIFMIVNICWECSRPVREGFQDQTSQQQIDNLQKQVSELQTTAGLALGIPYTASSIALLVKYLIATDVLPKNFPTKPSDIVTTIATKANQNNKNLQTPKQLSDELQKYYLGFQDMFYNNLSKTLDEEVAALKPKSRMGGLF